MIIYCATNKINGKRYIGQTIMSMHKRHQAHEFQAFKNESNFPFYKALRKYGKILLNGMFYVPVILN